jgi:hypothetical protein
MMKEYNDTIESRLVRWALARIKRMSNDELKELTSFLMWLL